jgi:hypothetical protein
VNTLDLALADADQYAPVETVPDPGERYAPTYVPGGWQRRDQQIWTVWHRPGAAHPDEGWKIHVSARLDRAADVLDTVANVCFAHDVPFKHVSARFFFLFLHFKHAHRAQSGKFCAIYPPDTERAHLLLEALSAALADEDGPYILSDRRYRGSRVVHYRYGAFNDRTRLAADGGCEPLVRDGRGLDAVDVRTSSFVLPDGIQDPFLREPPPPLPQGPLRIGNYEIQSMLQASNAGGTYRAVDTRDGRTVFLKEARAGHGLTWDGTDAPSRLRREHEALQQIHRAAPGVSPEPLDYFTEWEHDFLVTEFVPGRRLHDWLARTSPIVSARADAADFTAYYADCEHILASVERSLERLRDIGYRFGDLSPGNVIVTPEGDARLVDFETASRTGGPPTPWLGTPGYTPPEREDDPTDPYAADRYGLAALALGLLAPMHEVFERAPSRLALLRRDLVAMAPVPGDLWARARGCYGAVDDDHPTPAELDADPVAWLTTLADGVIAGLLAAAEPGRRDRMFPSPPEAFRANSICLAYGTAGVLHALHAAGVPVPGEWTVRLRDDAIAGAHELPPGLHVGAAGVAGVLAELGLLEAAWDVLTAATEHRLLAACNTVYGGRSGVGLVWLALHRATGDHRCLDHATRLGDEILGTAQLVPTLGRHDAVGLLHGRTGLALFLHYLSRDTGDQRYAAAGVRLLHAELDRAIRLPRGVLSFPDDAVTNRALPYLGSGSAGVGLTAVRYATVHGDERCLAALPHVMADADKTCCAQPGLYGGVAGLAYARADHDERSGDGAGPGEAPIRLATALWKYAVPRPGGIGFLTGAHARFSCDLATGAAGVLLAVSRVLRGGGGDLLTLDAREGGDSR